MRSATHHTTRLACLLTIALCLCAASLGCSTQESTAKPQAHQTQGGDSAFDRAGHNIDEAHQQFKQEVKPAAEAVDDKANAVVNEGRKAVHKVVDAIDGTDTSSPQPQAKSADK